MRSYEIHALSSHHDGALAVMSGLPEVPETANCASCREVVGPRGEMYFACSLILSDQESWVVCSLCSDPVLIIERSTSIS